MGSVLTKIVFAPPELATYSANQGKDGKGPIKWLDTPRGVSIPMIYLSVESPYTIIFSHGNAEDIGGCLHHFQEIGKRLNVSFVVYDYEGYGLAEGTPNEQACYDAIDAVYSHLVNELGRDPRKLFLWGRSLGSGPSSYLAARLSKEGCPPQGLILQSPPASIFRVAFDTRFTLPGDLFPNIDRMPQIACKVSLRVPLAARPSSPCTCTYTAPTHSSSNKASFLFKIAILRLVHGMMHGGLTRDAR